MKKIFFIIIMLLLLDATVKAQINVRDSLGGKSNKDLFMTPRQIDSADAVLQGVIDTKESKANHDTLQTDVIANKSFVDAIKIENENMINGAKIDTGTINNISLSENAFRRYRTFIVSANNANYRASSDYVCDGISDQEEINAAIAALPDSGGAIILTEGYYNVSSQIFITQKNVAILGQGKSTYINYTGLGSAIYSEMAGVIIKDIYCTGAISLTSLDSRIIDSYSSGIYKAGAKRSATLIVASTNSSLKSKAGSDYIGGISEINAAIAALPDSGGKIILMEGIYTGTIGLDINKNNITIEGQGYSTVIKRSSGNDWYIDPAKSRIVIKSISYTQKLLAATANVAIIDCWENGVYIGNSQKDYLTKGLKVIQVGVGKQYTKLSTALASITDNSTTNRYEIQCFGKITESSTIIVTLDYVDIVGHNAVIYLSSNITAAAISFASSFNGTVKDITFSSNGTSATVTNEPCGRVSCDNASFINVTFINNFINTTDPQTPDDTALHIGNRLHGLIVTGSSKFYNVKAYGSVGGNHDTRGIYVESNATETIMPYFIDCMGMGGGKTNVIGKPTNRGHGILFHTAASGLMNNCIGIAGGNGTEGSGIKCQSTANPLFNACIGYAGGGAGIYLGYRSSPTLNNCVGYSSDSTGSYGLEIGDESFPKINGGYFGIKEKNYDWFYDDANNGRFRPFEATDYYLTTIQLWVNVAHVGETIDIGTTIGGNEIADNVSIGTATWRWITFAETALSAGDYIYVTPSAVIADNDINLNTLSYANPSGSYALYLTTKGKTEIYNSKFKSNYASDCLYIDNDATNFDISNSEFICSDTTKNAISCESLRTLLPIYRSRLEGQLDNVSSFKAVNDLYGSSNWKK